MSKLKIGYIYSAVSAIFFGSAGILVKLAFNEGSDSIELLTVQYSIAVAIMFLILFFSNREGLKITKLDLFHTAVLGVVGNTFMTVFYYTAFSYLQVSMVTILLYTYPIIVFVYSYIFEKESIDRNKFFALMIAFIGCFLAIGFTSEEMVFSAIGIACGLLAAVFYAFMNLYSEKKLSHLNSLSINFYSTIFSLAALMIYRFPISVFNKGLTIKFIIYTVLLALICEIIPLTLLYAAIKHIGSIKVSIIGNLEIPTAMIISYIFLKESLTILQIIGSLMVIYAIYRIRN